MRHAPFPVDDRADAQGFREIIACTKGAHPYADHWWADGHILGYEHTFVHAVADFLKGVESGTPAEPTFATALQTQRVCEAILKFRDSHDVSYRIVQGAHMEEFAPIVARSCTITRPTCGTSTGPVASPATANPCSPMTAPASTVTSSPMIANASEALAPIRDRRPEHLRWNPPRR